MFLATRASPKLTIGVLASAMRSPEAIFRKTYPDLILDLDSQAERALTGKIWALCGGKAHKWKGLISG